MPDQYASSNGIKECQVRPFTRGHHSCNVVIGHSQGGHVAVSHFREECRGFLSSFARLAVDENLFVQFDAHPYPCHDVEERDMKLEEKIKINIANISPANIDEIFYYLTRGSLGRCRPSRWTAAREWQKSRGSWRTRPLHARPAEWLARPNIACKRIVEKDHTKSQGKGTRVSSSASMRTVRDG